MDHYKKWLLRYAMQLGYAHTPSFHTLSPTNKQDALAALLEEFAWHFLYQAGKMSDQEIKQLQQKRLHHGVFLEKALETSGLPLELQTLVRHFQQFSALNEEQQQQLVALLQKEDFVPMAERQDFSQFSASSQDHAGHEGATLMDSQSAPDVTMDDSHSAPDVTMVDSQSDPDVTMVDSQSDPDVTMDDSQSDPDVTMVDSQSDPNVTIAENSSDSDATTIKEKVSPAADKGEPEATLYDMESQAELAASSQEQKDDHEVTLHDANSQIHHSGASSGDSDRTSYDLDSQVEISGDSKESDQTIVDPQTQEPPPSSLSKTITRKLYEIQSNEETLMAPPEEQAGESGSSSEDSQEIPPSEATFVKQSEQGLSATQARPFHDPSDKEKTQNKNAESSYPSTLPRPGKKFSSQMGKPQVFGIYQILEEIGAGGMGKVYKAYHPHLDKTVAIKVMIRGGDINSEERKRFLKEAQLTARLQHPNIVAVHDSGTLEGTDYIVMDFIAGKTLQQYVLEKKEKLTPAEILALMQKTAEAVHYAHQNHIIHRDLKPSNILIQERNGKATPLVMDFGLAKNIEASVDQTREGQIMGTPRYMPPEQALGEISKISPRSDLYALGAILYELLAEKHAIEGDVPATILYNVIYKEVTPPRQLNPKIAPDLQTICLKALDKEPEKRYESCEAFAQDIQRFLNGEVILAKPSTIWERSWRKVKRNKGIASAIAACLLLVAGAFFWGWWEIRQDRLARLRAKEQKIATTLADTESFWQSVPQAAAFSSPPMLVNQAYRELSPQEYQQRTELLKKYSQTRKQIEDTLVLEPAHRALRQKLFEVEREIGLIALKSRMYIVSELAFSRCKSLGFAQEAEQLLAKLQSEQNRLRQTQLQRVEQIMTTLAQEIPEAGVMDQYVTEIVRMQGQHVVPKLVPYLVDGNEWQKLTAIETLGKLGDTTTKVADKSVVVHLMETLQEAHAVEATAVKEETVWALGRLRAQQALELVYQIRWDTGYQSAFWNKTRLPHLWIFQESGQDTTPTTVEGWVLRGIMYTEEKSYQKAISCFNEAIRINPNLAQLYNNRGNTKQQLGDTAGALLDYSEAIRRDPNYVDSYINRGLIRKQQQDYQAAINDFQTALSLDQQNIAAYINLGSTYQASKAFKQAIQAYSRAIEINPKDAYPYNNRAIAKKAQGDLSGAITDFTKAIEINPLNAQLYVNRGHVYKQQGKVALAIADYSTAIDRDPRQFSAYYARGLAYLLQDKFQLALKDFERVLRLNPDYELAYLRRADTWLQLGNLESALADYQYVLEENPESAAAYNGRGLVYSKRGELELALENFSQAIAKDANDEEAFLNRGDVYLQQAAFDKALEDFQHAKKLAPENAGVYYRLGIAYDYQGNSQQAYQNYSQAIALDPIYKEAYQQRASFLLREKRLKEAIADLNRAIELSPENSELYIKRGLAYHTLEKYDQALENFQHVIESHPEGHRGYYYQGVTYRAQGELKKAIAALTTSIAKEQQNPDAYIERGLAWQAQQEYDKAFADFSKAIEQAPEDPYPLNCRGNLHSLLGNLDKAAEDFSQVLTLDEENEDALLNRGYVLLSQQKYSRALQDFETLLKVNPSSAEAYLQKGNVLSLQGFPHKAIKNYNQAFPLAKSQQIQYNIYNNRAIAHKSLKKYRHALEDFNRAIRLFPNTADAYINRGDLWLEVKKYQRAVKDYSFALALSPNNAYLYHNRGLANKGLGKEQAALDDYSQALVIEPHADTYINRADIYFARGDWGKAHQDYSKALELSPEDAYVYDQRGQVKQKLGNYQAALQDHSQAIAIDASYAPSYKHRAMAYHHLENYQQAAEDLAKYVELRPNDPQAPQWRHYIKKYRN